MAGKSPKRERLPKKELDVAPFYEVGRPYLWTLGFGWGFVGFYVRHETPLKIRLAHASYFHTANKTYADLAKFGGDSTTQWRYEGNKLISEPHVLHVSDYYGEVHRGNILS